MDIQLRNKIINEAYKLFISKGIKSTSYVDIILSVQRSKGALTYYFPTKDKLIRSVVDQCFFPASQIPSEWDTLSKNNFSSFSQIYQNPIERVIHNFSFLVDQNKFMAYMQFVASVQEYMDDFNANYKQIWEQEDKFLEAVIQNAVTKGELSVTDIEFYQKYFLKFSLGHTLSSYLS